MPLHVLDPLDSIHLAFAFEIVPLDVPSSTTDISASPGFEALAAAADHATAAAPERRLFILYINPEQYEWGRPGAVSAQPAQGVVVPDDPGFAVQMLSISGRFGARERVAHNRFGEKAVLSGHEQFLECAGFIDDFQAMRAEGQPVELRFHAFRYQDHYAVLVEEFKMMKNRRTRIGSPEYRVQLKAYRKVDRSEAPVSFFETGPFGALSDIVSFATERVDSATIAVAELRAFASIPRRALAKLDPALDSSEALLREVGGLRSEVQLIQTLSFPQIRRTIDLVDEALREMEATAHQTLSVLPDLYDAFRTTGELARDMEALQGVSQALSSNGSRTERWGRQVAQDSLVTNDQAQTLADEIEPEGGNEEGGGRNSAIAQRLRRGGFGRRGISDIQIQNIIARTARYTGWVPYVLSEGDTPYSVASSLYRDPSRWIDVILANDLSPPFFGDAQGAASPGDIIRVPVLGAGPSIPFDVQVNDLPEFNADIERRIFGVDFELVDDDGVIDTKVDPGSNYLDWSTVEGFPCFVQRLDKVVLATQKGGFIAFPATGVAYRLGEPNLTENDVLLLLSAREAILSESAVRRIADERIERFSSGKNVVYDIDTYAAGPVRIRRKLR